MEGGIILVVWARRRAPPSVSSLCPPSVPLPCPPSVSSSFGRRASLSFCRRTSLSRVGVRSCSFWGVRIDWAVGLVGNGHRVEVGVRMAVVVVVYDDER